MKNLILLTIFCIALSSCTKEESQSILVGNSYTGIMNYKWDYTDSIQHTGAMRTFYKPSTQVLCRWLRAPYVETTLHITNDSYNIFRVVLPGDTWCNGNHIITTITFNGFGELRGDTLVEWGTLHEVTKSTNPNGNIIILYNDGVWKAKLTLLSNNEPSL